MRIEIPLEAIAPEKTAKTRRAEDKARERRARQLDLEMAQTLCALVQSLARRPKRKR